jgi:uncharacterized DUF497 family protein
MEIVKRQRKLLQILIKIAIINSSEVRRAAPPPARQPIKKQSRYEEMVILARTLFSWDEDKNKTNLRKHGISFREAATVFDDDDAIIIDDEVHSTDEERFIILGFSEKTHLLVVCHCYRDNDSLVRIISARKANKKETIMYGGLNYER